MYIITPKIGVPLSVVSGAPEKTVSTTTWTVQNSLDDADPCTFLM